MGRYIENYTYDKVGNILKMNHFKANDSTKGWSRTYEYEPDPIRADIPKSNRLIKTTPPGPNEGTRIDYTYDGHGNMMIMPHLYVMEWDFKDQLQATQKQIVNNGSGEKTYYVYDSSGQRVRKITETASGVRKQERMYPQTLFFTIRFFYENITY